MGGGLALLVLALPAATSRLEGADRTRLLAGCLARFSPIALGAVVALVATGTVQSILHLEALRDLVDAAFGRAILAKIVLLVGLVGLGALNREALAAPPAADRAGGRIAGARGPPAPPLAAR